MQRSRGVRCVADFFAVERRARSTVDFMRLVQSAVRQSWASCSVAWTNDDPRYHARTPVGPCLDQRKAASHLRCTHHRMISHIFVEIVDNFLVPGSSTQQAWALQYERHAVAVHVLL